MEKSKTFEELIVWQKAHAFVLGVYKLTDAFPRSELFGLTSQFRRAAVSIPANVAEGYKKQTAPDKFRLMNVAQGSLEECRYYLILANDLSYLPADTYLELKGRLEEVSRLLSGYMKALRPNP